MPLWFNAKFDDPEERRRYRWQLAGVLAGSALACGFVLTMVHQLQRPSEVMRQLLVASVYAVAIGLLSSATLHYLANLPIAKRRGFKLLTPVVGLLLTSTTGCLIAGLAMIPLRLATIAEFWLEFRGSVGVAIVSSQVFGLSMYFYQVQQHLLDQARTALREKQLEEERARKLAAEARLSSLESRIHPHFLFNTLNSIASLIPKDPKRAEEMVTKLAALLRFSLNANQAGLVPLSQEAAVTRNYLEIEKARFGERLRYAIDVPAELGEFGVPPLSLQSLVENSIKHVIAHRAQGGEIRVSAAEVNGHVELNVSDSGDGFSIENVPGGHGIHNLMDRLALLYGADASLEVLSGQGQSTVCLKAPRTP